MRWYLYNRRNFVVGTMTITNVRLLPPKGTGYSYAVVEITETTRKWLFFPQTKKYEREIYKPPIDSFWYWSSSGYMVDGIVQSMIERSERQQKMKKALGKE